MQVPLCSLVRCVDRYDASGERERRPPGNSSGRKVLHDIEYRATRHNANYAITVEEEMQISGVRTKIYVRADTSKLTRVDRTFRSYATARGVSTWRTLVS